MLKLHKVFMHSESLESEKKKKKKCRETFECGNCGGEFKRATPLAEAEHAFNQIRIAEQVQSGEDPFGGLSFEEVNELCDECWENLGFQSAMEQMKSFYYH